MDQRIRLLVTSDIHGYVFPYDDKTQNEIPSGLSRLSTIISSLRDDNTLVIDNGDVFTGSALSFYHSSFHSGEVHPLTKAMKHIGYDYINLGNHDFDDGEEALKRHLDQVGAACLTANVSLHGKTIGPSWAIEEIAGKKIAVFAVTTQSARSSQKRANIRHIRFHDAFETAARTVELLKSLEKPDYIICLYHGGFERDLVNGYPVGAQNGENEGYRMLREINGIDLLITGHQHRSLSGRYGSTVYTQLKDNACELACIDIYTDTGVIEPSILKADMPGDSEMLVMLKDEEKACNEWLGEVLALTDKDLEIHSIPEGRLPKSQAVTLINQLQREITGAQLSACSLTKDSPGFARRITNRDLFLNIPFPGTLTVKRIDGKTLREYLEKCAEYWTVRNDTIVVSPLYTEPYPRHHQYDMIDGVDYTIKVSNDPGERIISLTFQGEEVTDDMQFTIVMNSYRAAGNGGFTMLKNLPSEPGSSQNIVFALAEKLKELKTISFPDENNIHIRR